MQLQTRFEGKLRIAEKKVVKGFYLKFRAAFNGIFKNMLCEHDLTHSIPIHNGALYN